MTWLLLHGTPLAPPVWDGVRAHLGSDAVIAPDLTRVPDAGGAAQAHLAGEALAAAPDTGPMDVVGHSFGGQFALEVALQRPIGCAR